MLNPSPFAKGEGADPVEKSRTERTLVRDCASFVACYSKPAP